MAALCVKIDPLTIQLLGRWHSYNMHSYLHDQSAPLINYIDYKMLQFGNYHLLPNQSVPAILPTLEHKVAKIALQDDNPNEL